MLLKYLPPSLSAAAIYGVLLASSSSTTVVVSANILKGCAPSYDPDAGVDFFPAKYIPPYIESYGDKDIYGNTFYPHNTADFFTIDYHLSYKIVTNTHQVPPQTYLLYQCGTDIPQAVIDANDFDVIVAVPLQEGIAVTQTPTIPYLEMIGHRTDIKAYLGDTKYVTSPCMQHMLEDNSIETVGKAYTGRKEKIIEWRKKNPNILVVDGPLNNHNYLSGNVIVASTTQERTNVAMNAWTGFYAAFFNEEGFASGITSKLQANYDCTADVSRSIVATKQKEAQLAGKEYKKPTIMYAKFFKQSYYVKNPGWRVAACPQWDMDSKCEYAAHCGAKILSRPPGMGFSVTYPPSTTVYWYVSDAEVVELGKDADLLVYDGDDWDAIYKLKNKTLDKFRAVQEKNVYDTLGQGVSTWLEQGYAEYDTIGLDVCDLVGHNMDLVDGDTTNPPYKRRWFRNVFNETIGSLGTCDVAGGEIGKAYVPPQYTCVRPPAVSGDSGSIVGGGMELLTDVRVQLDRDLSLHALTNAMAGGSCDALEAGRKIYNEDRYFTSMPHYTGSIGVEMLLYENFYGPGFLEKWNNAAFNNGQVSFKNSAADFSKLPGKTDGFGDCVGREEAVKKGLAYTSTYIDLNQYFAEAIDKIQDGCIWSKDLYISGQPNPNPCTDAVHAWEKAVATWSGSMEGPYGRNLSEPGKTGKFLQALAEKRCFNFKTCGVSKNDSTNKGVTPRANMKIVAAFAKGRAAVFDGQLGVVRSIISEINKDLTVIRIQGVLRYAYRIGKNGSRKDKEIAEGGAFAFGLLPQIYACNKKSAAILAANTDIGSDRTSQVNGETASFTNVRAALECNYKCLGIRFADVGELNDCVGDDGNNALCFQKRPDKGNICKIKNSAKFIQKCDKVAPKENKNKSFVETRFGYVSKKRY